MSLGRLGRATCPGETGAEVLVVLEDVGVGVAVGGVGA